MQMILLVGPYRKGVECVGMTKAKSTIDFCRRYPLSSNRDKDNDRQESSF